MKNENPLSKPGTLSHKIQGLIDMYYIWRANNPTALNAQIHLKSESLNSLYFNYLKKNDIDMDEYENSFRSKMDFLTNCYTILREQEEKKKRKQALRELAIK